MVQKEKSEIVFFKRIPDLPSDPNLWVKKEDLPQGRYEVLGASIYKLKRFLRYDELDFIIHLKYRET